MPTLNIAGNFSYVFAVVAIDDEGNRSPRSNLATSTARDYRKSSFPYVWVIVGVGLLFIFIIIITVCFIYIVCCRRSKRTEDDVEKSKTKTKVTTSEQVYDEVVYDNANTKSGYVPEIKVGTVTAGIASFDNRAYENISHQYLFDKKKAGGGTLS